MIIKNKIKTPQKLTMVDKVGLKNTFMCQAHAVEAVKIIKVETPMTDNDPMTDK